jgi:hypothetical protein
MKGLSVLNWKADCFLARDLFFHGEILVPGKASPEVTAEA